MAFAIIHIEPDKETFVRETLSGIGLKLWSGSLLGAEKTQIGCPIDSVEQFNWIEMCPGVLKVEAN